MFLSHCCGAKPQYLSEDGPDSREMGLCPKCHNHCTYVEAPEFFTYKGYDRMRSFEATADILVDVEVKHHAAIGATLDQPGEPEHVEIAHVWLGGPDPPRCDILRYIHPSVEIALEEECMRQIQDERKV